MKNTGINKANSKMRIGEFIHLKDDLNFNLSMMAGTLIAVLIIAVDFIYYWYTGDKIGQWIYLLAMVFFILFMFLLWANYRFIRPNIHDGK